MATIDHTLTRADGTTITVNFQNDNPKGASPDVPLKVEAAKMVENGLKASNVSSVTINSTTGGHTTGDHVAAKAVDISQVNGRNVGTKAAAADVKNVQEAFCSQVKIRENFGPTFAEKTYKDGGKAQALDLIAFKNVIDAHQSILD